MKNWDFSEGAFSRFLARLNADPALAGEEYEKLRTRLIYFFERKGCRTPAELTDETINRVVRKIYEGQEIRDLYKFASGVARLVLLEHWDDPRREWEQIDERQSAPDFVDRDFDEQRLNCMRDCLGKLSPDDRGLITENCTNDKNGKLKLANDLGITINALRLKVFRIRTRLNECYEKCVDASSQE